MPLPPVPKRSNDNRLYTLDCTQLLDFPETIVSISSVVSSDPSVTVSGQSTNAAPVPVLDPAAGSTRYTIATGKAVQFRMSGGSAGLNYTVTALFTTSVGNTIEEQMSFFIYA